jgi:YidC/Oxa1 family membrane protein insertase
MDRRMLLAMLLAVLVLVANTVLFGRRTKPQPAAMRPLTERTIQPRLEPAVLTAMPAGPGTSLMVDPTALSDTAGVVSVDTKLLHVELDPVGGVIRAWKLLRYTDATGQPADLIRDRAAGNSVLILHDGASVIRTDSTRYHTFVESTGTETTVRFSAKSQSGILVQKTYRLPEDRYDCKLDVEVSGVGGDGYWELGWRDGLPVLERDPRNDYMAISSVALFGKTFIRTKASGGGFGCAHSTAGEKNETHDGTLRWMGVRNRYFLGALIPSQPTELRVETGYDGATHTASARLFQPFALDGGQTSASYTMYLGPIIYSALEGYGAKLERVQDLGPSVIRPFSRLIMKFFEAVHHVVPNYGFEILILSILIRLIFYPLTKKSMDSMKRMQQLKPEIDRINEKYKDDAERKNKEVLDLYRVNKINPLGGCLPVVVQLPVLSGLYYVLANAVQLRKEPFIFWIRDLSAPDTVAHVAGFPLNIMPLIMAGTMVWQQRLTPTDPRQASLGYVMPIFMTFLFYSTPSGLVFYWTISNLMTVLQQIWMNRAGAPTASVMVNAQAGTRPSKRFRGRGQ